MNGKDFTFSYNDANQIEEKNDTAYQYDKDGNLLQDEHYQYTYNEAQRLTSVQTLKGDVVASYTYDEDGLRLTKTVGDTTHEYFYNDEVLDMDVIKKNGEVTQYRYYEWNGYTPLGMIVKEKDTTGNFRTKMYQYITNQRGDVLSIRDQDDQEVGSYSYDAYGNVLSVEGDVAKDNPIRYAGYYYDEETKNYYLQARYYNSENGAFLALDPHPGDDDEPLSQNGYTYGNNNPVLNIDPDGNNPALIVYGLLLTIVRFAGPLIKRYGPKAVKVVYKFAYKLLKKYKKRYKIQANKGSMKGSYTLIAVIDNKSKLKNKRIFSIDYHKNIPIKKAGKKSRKDLNIWHYHLGKHRLNSKGKPVYGTGGWVHRVFKWDMPNGYKLVPNKNYTYA